MPTPIAECTDDPEIKFGTHHKVHSPTKVEFYAPGAWGFYNPIAIKAEGREFSKRLMAELAKGNGWLAQRARTALANLP